MDAGSEPAALAIVLIRKRRSCVRVRWQLAQTKSHLAISASTFSVLPIFPPADTLNFLSSRWSKSITHGGYLTPQSAHGPSFASEISLLIRFLVLRFRLI